MVGNGVSNGGAPVLVLYKVVNSKEDPEDGLYNCFQMPRGNGLTLAAVKHHGAALRHLSHMGSDGFHWRVCVEERGEPGSSSKHSAFSWWDIQDENAKLPIKEATTTELQRMFSPKKHTHESSDSHSAAKTAKGAFKTLGKAISGAVDGGDDHGPRVSVIAFKLLDLVKMNEDFTHRHGGTSAGHLPPVARAPAKPSRPAAAPAPAPRAPRPQTRASMPPGRSSSQPHQPPAARRTTAPPQQRAAPRPPKQEASLMDFDSPPAANRNLRHTTSSPAAFNETRAQKLKREYAQNQQKQNRVWDEVDQRWVAVEKGAGGVKSASTSAPPTAAAPAAKNSKTVGISLDPANAVGKSAHVAAAVTDRVNEMKASQAKALQEVRAREDKKKREEAEEDEVRKRLEPKIKAWSEEHGKKKQLRALLGTLHTILWPEAKWKPVSIGDILDDSKMKKCFHKASRVVHPDKTHHLSPENRFLAKRIFDALSQAKAEYDNSK